MEKQSLLRRILHWVCVFLFMAAGIAILILRHLNPTHPTNILGIIVLIAGCVKVAIYWLFYFKRNPRSVLLLSGLAFIILGIVFLLGDYPYEALCLTWGILDIVLGLVEIFTSIFELKEDKLQIAEILVAAGGIVFGVLLTIELAHGLAAHIIYLGISLILLACILVAEFIIHKVKGHKE